MVLADTQPINYSILIIQREENLFLRLFTKKSLSVREGFLFLLLTMSWKIVFYGTNNKFFSEESSNREDREVQNEKGYFFLFMFFPFISIICSAIREKTDY